MDSLRVFIAVLCVATAQNHNEKPNDFSRPNFHHYHHVHHHYRDPGFPGRSYQEGPFVITDGHVEIEEEFFEYSNNTTGIPLDFLKNLNEYNVTDLLLNFVEGDRDVLTNPFLENRFGDENSERRTAEMAKLAVCMPELKTVEIAHSDDPTILYIPQCTRVERCGGCCSHSLLSCQPTETEAVSYEVIKTQYTGGKKLKYIGKEIVVVEKHTKCKCDCRLKEQDCNQYQKYKKNECSCACTNMDEEKKCSKDTARKLWNPEVCACQCRDVMQCSTGSYFDNRECRCLPIPMKRRYADYERNKNE